MAFCMNCGAQLPASAKFCFECGEKQEKIEKKQPVKEEKLFVAVFEDEEESGYYEEEDGADFSSAYKEETPIKEPTNESPKAVQKQVVAEVHQETSTETDADEEFEEDVFEPVFEKTENVTPTPFPQPGPENFIEDDADEEFDEDEIDEDNLVDAQSPQKDVDLTQLSSYLQSSTPPEVKPLGFDTRNLKPVSDPYWDDVKPEIDNEIYKIDRSIIFKGIGFVVALFGIIVYLIYML